MAAASARMASPRQIPMPNFDISASYYFQQRAQDETCASSSAAHPNHLVLELAKARFVVRVALLKLHRHVGHALDASRARRLVGSYLARDVVHELAQCVGAVERELHDLPVGHHGAFARGRGHAALALGHASNIQLLATSSLLAIVRWMLSALSVAPVGISYIKRSAD